MADPRKPNGRIF
jgi:hypothetical protein